MIEIFDQDGNGEVDFKEFIEGVSQFSVRGDKDSKLKCKLLYFIHHLFKTLVAFKIYDMDKDGFISNGELFQVLKMMVGNNLKGIYINLYTDFLIFREVFLYLYFYKDTQLQQIVDKTIIYADRDGDGKISYEEFCAVSFRI